MNANEWHAAVMEQYAVLYIDIKSRSEIKDTLYLKKTHKASMQPPVNSEI